MSRHPAPAPDDRARRLPRAVLWDMDGTLVDTEPLWNAVQRRLVLEHGGTWSEDLAASLVGRPLDEGARRLQEAGLDLPVQRIIDLTMDEVVQGVVNGVPWPVMDVQRRVYRFRLLNASISRSASST